MSGVEFMKPLVDQMVQDDPSKRPTMAEVLIQFDEIRSRLGWWKLTSRLVRKDEPTSTRITAPVRHFLRTAVDTLAFRSALPTPKP